MLVPLPYIFFTGRLDFIGQSAKENTPRISKIVELAGFTLKHTLVLIVGNEPVGEESPQGQDVQINNT